MSKVIIGLFFVTIFALIWALQPAPDEISQVSASGSGQPSDTETTTSGRLQPQRRLAKDRAGKARVANPFTKGQVAAKAEAKDEPKRIIRNRDVYKRHPDSIEPPNIPAVQHPVATEGEGAVKGYIPWEDREHIPFKNTEDPFPKVAVSDLKDSVKRFYGGLAKDQVLPARVIAADVLPPVLIAGLGVAPSSELTMLGPLPVSDDRAYQHVMHLPDYDSRVMGVSWITPNGEKHRQYVRLTGEQK